MKIIFNVIFIFIIVIVCSCEQKSGRRNKLENQATSFTKKKTANNPQMNSRERRANKVKQIQDERKQTILSGVDIFNKYNSAVFMIYTSDGQQGFQGSGFFINNNGLAVSNYHVFKGTTVGYETIKLSDGREFKIKDVIGYNADKDYIVFKVAIGTQRVSYIPISDRKPRVGEKAYAIGSPRGLENTFSSGEISQIRNNDLLQISVPIDHGSSGGVLLNCYGEAIGVTTSGYDDSTANLNFAISINIIMHLI